MRLLYYLFGEGLAWFDVAAVSRLAFSLNHSINSGKIQQQQQKNSNRKGERTREDRKRPTDTQDHISFFYYFLLYLITERKSHGFPIPCYAFGYYNCDFIRFFFSILFLNLLLRNFSEPYWTKAKSEKASALSKQREWTEEGNAEWTMKYGRWAFSIFRAINKRQPITKLFIMTFWVESGAGCKPLSLCARGQLLFCAYSTYGLRTRFSGYWL